MFPASPLPTCAVLRMPRLSPTTPVSPHLLPCTPPLATNSGACLPAPANSDLASLACQLPPSFTCHPLSQPLTNPPLPLARANRHGGTHLQTPGHSLANRRTHSTAETSTFFPSLPLEPEHNSPTQKRSHTHQLPPEPFKHSLRILDHHSNQARRHLLAATGRHPQELLRDAKSSQTLCTPTRGRHEHIQIIPRTHRRLNFS